MPATSRSVVGMAHSYKKHYPATPALKENRIASKLAPTGPLSTGPCLRTRGSDKPVGAGHARDIAVGRGHGPLLQKALSGHTGAEGKPDRQQAGSYRSAVNRAMSANAGENL
ncbi:hypothetical protein D9M69_671260 [compost metagenome]